MIELFQSPEVWFALLTLTFLEIVLGIDNILFITISAEKLQKAEQKKARIGRFVNERPSMQILGLAFLLLIGFMLIIESAHLGHFSVFGKTIGEVPKGYLYFAIAFSVLVEFLDLRRLKNTDLKKL